MNTKKQVDASHYDFGQYMSKVRWISLWHQLDEVIGCQPKRVLEIGPGLGLLKSVAGLYGVKVETLDIDPDLKPDHLASIFEMPFRDGGFDVVCAFQVLEHLEYDKSLKAVVELARVAGRHLLISLPEATKRYPLQMTVPRLGLVTWQVPYPHLKAIPNVFDGQHYWEIGKRGFALDRITAEYTKATGMNLAKCYLVPENPRHRFFIYERKGQRPQGESQPMP